MMSSLTWFGKTKLFSMLLLSLLNSLNTSTNSAEVAQIRKYQFTAKMSQKPLRDESAKLWKHQHVRPQHYLLSTYDELWSEVAFAAGTALIQQVAGIQRVILIYYFSNTRWF